MTAGGNVWKFQHTKHFLKGKRYPRNSCYQHERSVGSPPASGCVGMEAAELAATLESGDAVDKYDAISDLKSLEGEELSRFAPQLVGLLDANDAYLATAAEGLLGELASAAPHALVGDVETLCTHLDSSNSRTVVAIAEVLVAIAQEEDTPLPLEPSDIDPLYHNRFGEELAWEEIRRRRQLAVELLACAPNPANLSWLERVEDSEGSNLGRSAAESRDTMQQYVYPALAASSLDVRRPAARMLTDRQPDPEEFEENLDILLNAVDDARVAEQLTPLLIRVAGERVKTSRVLDELLGGALDSGAESEIVPPEARVAADLTDELGPAAAQELVDLLDEHLEHPTGQAHELLGDLDRGIRTLTRGLGEPATAPIAERAIVALLTDDAALANQTAPILIDLVTDAATESPEGLASITVEVLTVLDAPPPSVDIHTVEWLVHKLGAIGCVSGVEGRDQQEQPVAERRAVLRDLVVAITLQSSSLTRSTVVAATEAFDDDQGPEVRSVLLELVDEAPREVALATPYLETIFENGDPATRRLVLEILTGVASAAPHVVADQPAFLEQALLDDESRIRRHACRLIEALRVYPQPEALRTLKNDDSNHQVQERASETYYALRGDKPTLETAGRSELPRPTAPTTNSHQLVRWETGGWTPVELCEFDEQLIHRLLEKVDTGEDGGVVLPYYDPSMVVLFAVELLNRCLNDDLNVVVFGGGTSSHWGTKTDIKDCYKRLGLASAGPDANRSRMLPMNELFPTARVTDSGVIERDRSTPGGSTLTVCRRFDRLQAIDTPDVVLFGLGSRVTDDLLEQVGEAKEEAADVPMVLTQALHTHQETGGYPEYRPRFDIIAEPTMVGPDDLEDLTGHDGAGSLDHLAGADPLRDTLLDAAPPSAGSAGYPHDSDLRERALTRSRTLRIEGIETPELTESMATISELTMGFAPGEFDRTAAQAQYALSFLERVPVPLEYHDEWIADQRAEGGFRLPRDSDRVIRDLREAFESAEGPGYSSLRNRVVPQLEGIRTRLLNSNPMFERLKAYIDLARDSQHDVAIFCPKRTWTEMLRGALADLESIRPEHLDDWGVDIVDPKTCRGMDVHSILVFVGPQRTHLSGFYLHPRANLISVLTYGGRWEERIGGTAGWFVKQLNEGFGGRVFPYPETELVGHVDSAIGADDDGPTGLELAQAFKRAADASDSGQDHEIERRKFRIELDDGSTLTRWSTQKILKRSTEQIITEGEYRWNTPDFLKAGDTIYNFGERRSQLWRDHLEATWEDEEYEAEANILRGIKLWHEHMRALLESETGWNRGEKVQPAAVSAIYSELEEALDRGKGAVTDWLEGVAGAEEPLDLVENPALRIGPQRVEDIRTVGTVFDIEPFESNAEFIEYSMRAFRTLNRQEGFDFQSEVVRKMAAEGQNAVQEAAQRHRIDAIEEVSDD